MSLRVRFLIIFSVFVWGCFYVVPNFLKLPETSMFAKNKLKYGLDLQGGLHLVMGVDINSVIQESADRLAGSIKDQVKKDKNIEMKSAGHDGTDKARMVFEMMSPTDVQVLSEHISKNYPILQVMETQGNKLTVRYLDNYLLELKKKTLDQAIETIRNRIDEFGVSEPSIAAQGEDRILIQLPGISDSTGAKQLINRTARLEFQILDYTKSQAEVLQWVQEVEKAGQYSIDTMKYSDYVKRVNEDLKSRLPEKTKILFAKNEKAENINTGKVVYLLRNDTALGGDSLKDAFVSHDQYNNPEISLSFNPAGAQRFADITGASIGKQMAIILDDVVYSAPNIQSKIPDGNARITLGGGRNYEQQMAEAKSITMALRAGALPAKLEQLEERTVGPSLGSDAIQAGAKAAIIATLLVVGFMFVVYKSFGLIANIALMFNLFLTFAVLTALGATLSLPGIAAMALTVGIAVDANVIIFERIKEESKKGNNFQSAISHGFERALSAILDGNITTVMTCIVLVYFGTGPVRGFGVTLTIGLITSMFTAVFFSRFVLDFLVQKMNMKKLSI